jgi:hypothetical protein
MKLARVVLSVLALLASASAIDRNAFTFTRYDLNVRIEPEQQRIGVRGTISLRNRSASPQKLAVLQVSSSLDWRSIQSGGKPLQFVSQPYTSDIDHTGSLAEAIVTLLHPVAPNGSVDLEFGYEGTVPLDTTRLKRIGVPDEEAKHTDWDQISSAFTSVRGVGHVVWYPVAMDAASLSDANSVFETIGNWNAREAAASMRINLCTLTSGEVPTALMNERVIGVPSGNSGLIADGELTSCTEHLFNPIGIVIPSFDVGVFDRLDKPTLVIYYSRDHKSLADAYGTLVDKVTPFLQSWLGQTRQKTKVIELPDPAAAPFESGTTLLTPFSSDSKLAEITLAHQIAHSMFISPRAWVDEGVPHFAQALWREHESGRQAALDYMGLHRTALVDAEKLTSSQPDTAGQHALPNTVDEEFYRSKAMFVWWILRDIIGDAGLKRALSAYDPEKDKNQAYVQNLLQSESKRNLAWLFDDWVYSDRGLPDFRVLSAYPRSLDSGAYMVTVTVENLGNAAAEVPITINMQEGEVTKRLQVGRKTTASIRIEAPSAPVEVIVNDGSVPESDMSNNVFRLATK